MSEKGRLFIIWTENGFESGGSLHRTRLASKRNDPTIVIHKIYQMQNVVGYDADMGEMMLCHTLVFDLA